MKYMIFTVLIAKRGKKHLEPIPNEMLIFFLEKKNIIIRDNIANTSRHY